MSLKQDANDLIQNIQNELNQLTNIVNQLQDPQEEPTEPEIPILSYFVAVNGLSTNDGTINSPWDLETGLNKPLEPGSFLFIREGTYNGSFTCNLKGEVENPITVMNYNKERVILSNSLIILDIQDSHYVNFIGLEICDLNNVRNSTRSESGYGIRTHQGYNSHHIKYINMIIHDVPAQGFGWWLSQSASEIYGCIIYFNGFSNQLDHGIYTKNSLEETKIIENNFIFDNASHGIHAYDSNVPDTLCNFEIRKNILFNNGSIGTKSDGTIGSYKRNILVGDYQPVKNNVIAENISFYPSTSGEVMNLGYNGGGDTNSVYRNVFIGGQLRFGGTHEHLEFNNNAVQNTTLIGINLGNYPNNTEEDPEVVIYKNKYDNKRFHVFINNAEMKDEIQITPEMLQSAGINIPVGKGLLKRNVQDYFDDLECDEMLNDGFFISTGKSGLYYSVAQPIGLDRKPNSIYPRFGAFVVEIE